MFILFGWIVIAILWFVDPLIIILGSYGIVLFAIYSLAHLSNPDKPYKPTQ